MEMTYNSVPVRNPNLPAPIFQPLGGYGYDCENRADSKGYHAYLNIEPKIVIHEGISTVNSDALGMTGHVRKDPRNGRWNFDGYSRHVGVVTGWGKTRRVALAMAVKRYANEATMAARSQMGESNLVAE